MTFRIADAAADPQQYDRDELIWSTEGSKNNPNRKLYLLALEHALSTLQDKTVLDIGCGQGWLCDEILNHGGKPLGIEPSAKNVKMARTTHPDLEILHTSLQGFVTTKQFDDVFAIMVLEHFLDLEAALKKIASLLKATGHFIAVVGDFDKFSNADDRHATEKEILGPGEVATRTDYGERAGVLCDIIRTVDRYVALAKNAGLTLHEHRAIEPEPWHHRYETHKDKPIFHLLDFVHSTI